MNRKLKQSLIQQKQTTKQIVPQITGILGLPLNGQRRVEVSNRNAYVYVRLRNNESEVIEAFNNQVSPAYNLPVLVERQGNRYVVIGVDTQRYENNWNSFAPFLPRHGNTHSFALEAGGGGDIVWVYSPQFIPLLVMPSGSAGGPNVFINAYTLKNDNGTWKYIGNTGTQNLTTYNPTSATGAVMVLVYADSVSGNPYILVGSGTVFSNSITGANAVLPYIPSLTNPAHIPLAAVRLITGSSALSWNNIYDVRQWLHTTPTGSSGGAGGITIGLGTMVQDEGIPVGTGTTFNFVGANVHASISGSVVRIFVTGSSGGVGTTITYNGEGAFLTGSSGDTISAQDEGVLKGSVSTFNFVGSNIDVTVSGSVARVFVTGASVSGLDSTYLRLDTANDPLYNGLNISGSLVVVGSMGGGREMSSLDFARTAEDNSGGASDYVARISQLVSSNGGIEPPVLRLYREPNGAFAPQFRESSLQTDTYAGGGTIRGGVLNGRIEGTTRVELNPSATGTSYIFDTDHSHPAGGKILSVRNFGTEKFYVNMSGTAYSNDAPLIKEAPVDNNSYVRKNAGWTKSPLWLPFGAYTSPIPLTADDNAYSVTLDRTVTFITWSQAVYVDTTNDGSNYWSIKIIKLSGSVINTITTAALSAGVWNHVTDSSFDIASAGTADTGLLISCTKTGAPGALYLLGPSLEVSV